MEADRGGVFPERSRSEARLATNGGNGIAIEQRDSGLIKVVRDTRAFPVRLAPLVELGFEVR